MASGIGIDVPDRRTGSSALFGRVCRVFLLRHWLPLLLSFVFMWMVGVASSAQTYLMKPLIDKVFIDHDHKMLTGIAGGLIVIFAGRAISRYAQELLLMSMGQKIVAEAQVRLLDKVFSQDVAWVRARNSGSLAAHFTYDANMLRAAVCDVFLAAGKDSITVISMIVVLFFENWRLALVTVALPILAILPVKYLGRNVRIQSLRMQIQTGLLSQVLTRSFQGARTVKSLTMAAIEEARFEKSATALTSAVIKNAWIGGAILPIVDALAGLSLGIVVIAGGYQVIRGEMTSGSLFVFVSALVGAYAPIPSLSKVNVKLQTGLAAAERIFAILDSAPSVAEPSAPLALPREAGNIEFRDVTFAYEGCDPVLRKISFVASAGETTAIVGPVGAGKSTILALIVRFYDPTSGEILINGLGLKRVSLSTLYNCVSLVSQDCPVLDDTVGNNIRFGKVEATDAEVEAAAAAAGALDFIRRLPKGFETTVGELGGRLSGGQRQRLALARAILRDAPIVLLDETTSAQDGRARNEIHATLNRFLHGKTVIVVSHHLSSVKDAERIYVVDEGKVVQTGTHAQLATENGIYGRLFKGEQISDTVM